MQHRAVEPLPITSALAPVGALLALVLLLVAGLFPTVGQQLPLELVPVQVVSTPGNPPADQLFLRVQGSNLWLNGTPVTREALSDTLRLALAGQPDGLVFVSLDGALPYQEALSLLSLIAQAGGRAAGLVSHEAQSAALPPSTQGLPTLPAASSQPEVVPSSPEVTP